MRTGYTDWNAITLFYEQLVHISPALGALVGRAAAFAEVKGPEHALSLLDVIEPASVLSYQPYWAVRAHLLKCMSLDREAAEAFDRAIGLAEDAAVRRFLQERRAAAEAAVIR
jgi:RNA polymerase sigma-70 factor (ECF subfamily)